MVTRICNTHTFLLGIIYPRMFSAFPFCICYSLYTSFPFILVSTVAVIIFGRNGIFIRIVCWSLCWGNEEKKMKMKTEDARKKLQDWRWVVGMGWQFWTSFVFDIQRSSWVLAMATVHSKLARKSVVLTKALCHHGEAADATPVPCCGILLGFEMAGLACSPPISTNRM